MTNIIVDPRFRDKIPKPSEEERRRLEENILADGYVREPIVLWAGHNTLVDGHNRWEIIQAHPELPYQTVEQEFSNEWEVIAWICRNQLGRRNISKVVYDKLIQEEHDAVQNAQGGTGANQYTAKEQSGENLHSAKKTRAVIAEEHGITEGAVKTAVEFGRGLDAADEVVPGFKDEILSGNTSAKKSEIAKMRKMEPEQIAETVEEIRNPKPKVTFPTGKNNWKSKPTAADEEIAKRDERVTNRHAKVEYTVEDLVEELTIIQNDFFQKYLLALDVHRDVALDTAKGRREVLGCIKEFEKKFNTEVKEIFK